MQARFSSQPPTAAQVAASGTVLGNASDLGLGLDGSYMYGSVSPRWVPDKSWVIHQRELRSVLNGLSALCLGRGVEAFHSNLAPSFSVFPPFPPGGHVPSGDLRARAGHQLHRAAGHRRLGKPSGGHSGGAQRGADARHQRAQVPVGRPDAGPIARSSKLRRDRPLDSRQAVYRQLCAVLVGTLRPGAS